MEPELTGEFRKRQYSFHSTMSKTAPKRPAAVPLDFPQSQRPRLEDGVISSSAPEDEPRPMWETDAWNFSRPVDPHLPLRIPKAWLAELGTEKIAEMERSLAGQRARAESSNSAVLPTNISASSSPFPPISSYLPLGKAKEGAEEVEDEEEEEEAQHIVRPEDISLYNLDSGLGYRAKQYEYQTDESDDDEDMEDEEEEVDPILLRGDTFPTVAGSEFPVHPRSPSSSVTGQIVNSEGQIPTLPYTTPLDLQCTFDATMHMGLLMIDPTHQARFSQLNYGFKDPLMEQFERENAERIQKMESALLLNTDLDEVDDEEEVEEVEVLEEEDYHPPNPPSSPVNMAQ